MGAFFADTPGGVSLRMDIGSAAVRSGCIRSLRVEAFPKENHNIRVSKFITFTGSKGGFAVGGRKMTDWRIS